MRPRLRKQEEATGAAGKLRQFYLRTCHADKFLVMYALFKLNRIPGRSLIFVNSVLSLLCPPAQPRPEMALLTGEMRARRRRRRCPVHKPEHRRRS